MSTLPIYLYGQSILRKKARVVRGPDAELAQFADDMGETMRKANGIGLAANQVGDLRRVIVVDIGAMEESEGKPPLAMINPEILSGDGEWRMEEGCLSIPDLREEVSRHEAIRVRFKDVEFQEREIEASGLLARVIQHEVDHLDGVLFIDHLSAMKRKLLRGRLNKISRGKIEVAYPVVGKSHPGEGESR